MKFSIQLSAYYPDKAYGGDRLYADMLEQAIHADQLGFDAVSITEHHLINILLMPAPLVFATKIAAHTSRIKIMTSVVVLPLHDMRTFAGEVVVADIFCEGRLLLGVGRGAYTYEIERIGVPMDETRARFDESLEVLQALLSREEVSWNGEFYQFEPLTVMPRPVRPGGPPLMVAVMNPEGIYHSARRGFHIQTTPLAGNHQLLVDQVNAFTRAKADMGGTGGVDGPVDVGGTGGVGGPGDVGGTGGVGGSIDVGGTGDELTLSLSRVAYPALNKADARRKLEAAYEYYKRFDNVFTGPGIVDNGMVRPLERQQTIDELAESLLICEATEMVDRLGPYQELGIDRVILNVNFGASQSEILDCLARLAEDVMPHFSDSSAGAAE